MASQIVRFTEEGGKFHLAEALFHAFRYKIRCPKCIGNASKPGFIKDEAGKGSKDGRPRRQWACQRSNSKTIAAKCPRISCTEYIGLAIQQLDLPQFRQVFEMICEKFPPDQEEYALLQAYNTITDPGSSSAASQPSTSSSASSLPATVLGKRKALEELPVLPKAAQHSQFLNARTTTTSLATKPAAAIGSLQTTLEHLEAMIEMSKTWIKQHELLTIFLSASSPPRSSLSQTADLLDEMIPRLSPTMLPSSSMPSSIAPSPSTPSAIPPPSIAPSSSIPSAPPIAPSSSTPSIASPSNTTIPPLPKATNLYPPDATIPCSYPEEDLSSLPMLPADPLQKARALVDMFLDQGLGSESKTKIRQQIRQQARDEGVLGHFQSLLFNRQVQQKGQQPQKRQRTITPMGKKPELKCSEPK